MFISEVNISGPNIFAELPHPSEEGGSTPLAIPSLQTSTGDMQRTVDARARRRLTEASRRRAATRPLLSPVIPNGCGVTLTLPLLTGPGRREPG